MKSVILQSLFGAEPDGSLYMGGPVGQELQFLVQHFRLNRQDWALIVWRCEPFLLTSAPWPSAYAEMASIVPGRTIAGLDSVDNQYIRVSEGWAARALRKWTTGCKGQPVCTPGGARVVPTDN
jgi:hypothetical protein